MSAIIRKVFAETVRLPSFLNVTKGFGEACKATRLYVRFTSQTSVTERPKTLGQDKVNDIFVIGAGCIGQGLTASLLKSNMANRVFLIGKMEHVRKIKEVGMTLQGAVEEKFSPNKQFVVSDKINYDLLSEHKIAENPVVFSSTKASDAVSSLSMFRDTLSTLHPTLICLQNGLGLEKEIEKLFPLLNATVLKGHVFGAVHKKTDDIFAYKGRIIIGNNDIEISRKLKTIFGQADNTIFNLEISHNILQAIYPKVAVNCVCNSLSVILNQNLGSIRTQHEPLIRMICNEVYTVAASQGISLSSADNVAEIVLDTMSKFSSHYSSMYLDHQAGKLTEIDYINGAILKIAEKKGIEVPVNQLLTRAIKEIEGKRMTCASSGEFYQKYSLYLERIKNELFKMAKVE